MLNIKTVVAGIIAINGTSAHSLGRYGYNSFYGRYGSHSSYEEVEIDTDKYIDYLTEISDLNIQLVTRLLNGA